MSLFRIRNSTTVIDDSHQRRALGERWVRRNDLEAKLLQGTRHLEIFLEILSRTMKDKNVIIKKLLNNYLGRISNLS